MASCARVITESGSLQACLPDHIQNCYVQLIADLGERLSFVKRSFTRVCVLGDHLALVVKAVRACYPHADIHTVAIPSFVKKPLKNIDMGSYDLVVDWERLHREEDPQEKLIQARNLLKDGGLYIGGCWGNETLHSFHKTLINTDLMVFDKAYQRLLPFIKPQSVAQLLQYASFSLPVCDWDRIQVKYARVEDVLRDLMVHTGIPLLGYPVTSTYLRVLQQNFSHDHAEKALSFDWLWFMGWAPIVSKSLSKSDSCSFARKERT
ncbi:MAG: hypothetical protein H6849_03570 [Alphaproteobacteria bacterium]|nr:MAG: hypothetical protein H6849_03570 [Alphaproteobacteria bacterium]